MEPAKSDIKSEINNEIQDKRAERPIPILRIIAALIIATIIFFAGFLLSYELSYSKYQSVAISQEQIRYNFLSLELEKQIMSSSCNLLDLASYSNDLDNMGSSLSILEEKLGKNNQQVLDQKSIYSMLEVQHFLLIKDYNINCNKNIPTLLFFYSNKDNDIKQAEKVGYILSSYKQKNKDTMIYSFDYDLDTNLINLLKRKYNITQPNTVIINEKVKLTQITNINDITNAAK